MRHVLAHRPGLHRPITRHRPRPASRVRGPEPRRATDLVLGLVAVAVLGLLGLLVAAAAIGPALAP